MHSIEEMSTEELLRAIDYCVDIGTGATPRGFADDYAVGNLEMAKIYRRELKRRENMNKREKTHE